MSETSNESKEKYLETGDGMFTYNETTKQTAEEVYAEYEKQKNKPTPESDIEILKKQVALLNAEVIILKNKIK